MATKNTPPAGSGRLAGLLTPRAILATAVLAAAAIVYLFTVGPLGATSLPDATRTPGFGSPISGGAHLACGDAGIDTRSVDGAEPATLDQIALDGRERAGRAAAQASLYQIMLDVPDEATATQARITWGRPGVADPVAQVDAVRAADGQRWVLTGVSTCG